MNFTNAYDLKNMLLGPSLGSWEGHVRVRGPQVEAPLASGSICGLCNWCRNRDGIKGTSESRHNTHHKIVHFQGPEASKESTRTYHERKFQHLLRSNTLIGKKNKPCRLRETECVLLSVIPSLPNFKEARNSPVNRRGGQGKKWYKNENNT